MPAFGRPLRIMFWCDARLAEVSLAIDRRKHRTLAAESSAVRQLLIAQCTRVSSCLADSPPSSDGCHVKRDTLLS